MKSYFVVFAIILSSALKAQDFKFIEPSQYICHKADEDFIIDGNLNKEVWSSAEWTDLFVDIEGRNIKKPYYNTRAKMLWSDQYLYFAFELKDRHIWSTLTQRDTVIFYDNDIEIFIDANGDTHNYIELELNALNTVWDLFLPKPYRQGGPPLNEFDFKGLKTSVKINGTLNNPRDEDESWTVEVAIPWSNLTSTYTYRRIPRNGEHMRINFSRVQWDSEIKNGIYRKKTNPKTGKTLPENNWVWSPIGAIDMHRPELWGIVYFAGNTQHAAISDFYQKDTEELRQLLAYIYKVQLQRKKDKKSWFTEISKLNIESNLLRKYHIQMKVLEHSFEIQGTTPDNIKYCCNTEGRLFIINQNNKK